MRFINVLQSCMKEVKRVVFIFLISLFFIIHGVAENFGLIPYSDVFILILQYLSTTIILYFFFGLLFNDCTKSALAVLLILFIYFFFGSLHDFLKSIAKDTIVIKYSFLLPSLLLLYLATLYLIKKITVGRKVILFLNVLFVVLITFDVLVIALKSLKDNKKPYTLSTHQTVDQPNIFLIVLDGYAGQDQLTTAFNFNNSYFLDSLQSLGFMVMKKSRSNYISTVFSTASLLNMEFVDLQNLEITVDNFNHCYYRIATSRVVSALRYEGYDFYNYSVFDFINSKSIAKKTVLVTGIGLITSQTLINRFKKDVYNNLLMTYFRDSKLYRDFVYRDNDNNIVLYKKTIEAAKDFNKPKFVYTHLMMPHFPYYFDENGKPNPLELIGSENMRKEALYLKYLRGTNTKVLALINEILTANEKPPVILVLSDHGYRYTIDNPSLYFSNLAAIYLPDKNYRNYSHSISNVNQFRILFNTLFNQRFTLLPDKQLK